MTAPSFPQRRIMNETFEDIKAVLKSIVKKQSVKTDDTKLAREFIKQTKTLNKNIETLSDGVEYVSDQLAELTEKLDGFLEEK